MWQGDPLLHRAVCPFGLIPLANPILSVEVSGSHQSLRQVVQRIIRLLGENIGILTAAFLVFVSAALSLFAVRRQSLAGTGAFDLLARTRAVFHVKR
jgi:hypothetical protein